MVSKQRAFTLIELLVVMTIVATLLTLVVPKYIRHVDVAKETVLRQNLAQIRDAIDKYRADNGRYPGSLDELVEKRYLRSLPRDPVADSTTAWVLAQPKSGEAGALADVHSGAAGKAPDGSAYSDW